MVCAAGDVCVSFLDGLTLCLNLKPPLLDFTPEILEVLRSALEIAKAVRKMCCSVCMLLIIPCRKTVFFWHNKTTEVTVANCC